MSEDLYATPQAFAQPIPERRAYVPAWYERHSDLSLPVKYQGQPVGFTIGEVLPERRWAIRPDGELMMGADYPEGFRKLRGQVCAPDGTLVPLERVGKYISPLVEPVPDVLDYVNAKPDPYKPQTVNSNPMIPIVRVIRDPQHPDYFAAQKYDPKAGDPTRIEPKYTHTGEAVSDGTVPQGNWQRKEVTTELVDEPPAAPLQFVAEESATGYGWYDIKNAQTGEFVKKSRKSQVEADIAKLVNGEG
jgi:hypothetical protein